MPRAGGNPVGGHSSGSFPAAPPSGGTLADNKVVWIVLGVVALLAVVVILVAASGGGGDESGDATTGDGGSETAADGDDGDAVPSGYTDEVEAAYVSSCSASGGEAACECSWDAIVEQIPFEEFEAIEAQIVDDPTLATDPTRFAEEFPQLQEIMEGCVGAPT